MNKIYVIRHGDYTHDDGSLTENGKEQARQLGGYLGFDPNHSYVIYTSPIQRAFETAEIIATRVKTVGFIPIEMLREIVDGETFEELEWRAKIALRMAMNHVACDAIIVSHRALIQAMLHDILKKPWKEIQIEKGQGYELSTEATADIRYEDRFRVVLDGEGR